MPDRLFRPLRAALATRRRRVLTAALAAAAVTGSVLLATAGAPGDPYAPHGAPPLPDPEVYTAPAWSVLGGDAPLTAATWATLNDPAHSDLPAGDASALAGLGRRVVLADLTGAGRGALAALYPPPSVGAPTTTRCGAVTVLAANAAALPVTAAGRYAKVLVAWTGTCGTTDPGAADTPQVSYVYARADAHGWIPLRAWAVPAADPAGGDAHGVDSPADWQLSTLGACGGGSDFRARIEVAQAFDLMCAAARTDGVTLTVESAYRTRAEQAALFAAAVKHYGSVEDARRWVAYADATTCESKHCAGTAVDVAPTAAALRWLTATVGCDAGGKVTGGTSCPAGASPVPRSARYGFVAPAPQVPGYYEFIVPLGADGATPADCSPSGVAVPQMVAAVFRCRLARAGVPAALVEHAVAEAEVVSRAESGWNAAARAYAGRFAATPNPSDGRTYTQAGVFMISAAAADAGWVPGGAAALTDPVANINGAASMWLATRSFEQFGCATGRADGFETGPVLPEFGGPALPAWAAQY